MHHTPPPRKPARTPYTPLPGVVTVVSDNPPRSLAMVTAWGFKRRATTLPGEAYRCQHPDGRIAAILDEERVRLVLEDAR